MRRRALLLGGVTHPSSKLDGWGTLGTSVFRLNATYHRRENHAKFTYKGTKYQKPAKPLTAAAERGAPAEAFAEGRMKARRMESAKWVPFTPARPGALAKGGAPLQRHIHNCCLEYLRTTEESASG